MNGICYEIPTDLVSPSTKLIPLVVGSTYQVEKFNDNVIYTYGMATMGMSVHYSAGVRVVYFSFILSGVEFVWFV